MIMISDNLNTSHYIPESSVLCITKEDKDERHGATTPYYLCIKLTDGTKEVFRYSDDVIRNQWLERVVTAVDEYNFQNSGAIRAVMKTEKPL